MSQKTSPFLAAQYGWDYGESGWNIGMDENLLKFSYLFDRNIQGVVSTLPSAVDGLAYFLTTDNRLYFAIGTTWYSSSVPKWFILTIKATGETFQFNGTSLISVPSNSELSSQLEAVQVTLSGLGTASLEDVGYFASQSELDVVSAQANSYTDSLRDALLSPAGGSQVGYNNVRTLSDKSSDIASVLDFGAIGDNATDCTLAFALAQATGKKVYIPAGIYRGNFTVNTYFVWVGDGNQKTILRPFDSSKPVLKNMSQEPNWYFSNILEDIGFESVLPKTGIGFSYGDPAGYTTRQEYIGRVVMNNVSFTNFNKGIMKCFGNIGNVYNNVTLHNNNYGSYALGAQFANPASSTMQSTNDTWNQGEAHANEIAAYAYIDTTLPLGHVTFNQTTIQFNKGFGLFISAASAANTVHPIIWNNVWDEANGTAYPGLSGHTVVIDTITGPQTLAPKSRSVSPSIRGFVGLGLPASRNSFNTQSTNGTVSIWGDQRNALNLISGFGDGANSHVDIGFSTEGSETTIGAAIRSANVGGTPRSLLFLTNNLTSIPLSLRATGQFVVGTAAASFATPAAGVHVLWGENQTAGATQVQIAGRFAQPTNFNYADAGGANAGLSAMSIGRVASTLRSINAAGTINASGADYAEYENNNGNKINKGDIVGFDENGNLTLKYSESFRFGIKSTEPSYVGGDTWGSEEVIGERPVLVHPECVTDVELETLEKEHHARLKVWEVKYQEARNNVDRIAYSGKVPVNIKGASIGEYIVICSGKDDSIVGTSVKTPTYDQYLRAVGRVNRLLADGRCEVAVITH